MSDPVTAFASAMQAAGIEPPEITPDGALHRFASSGKRGDDSGWYVLHGDGVPAGSFGCWRSGISETWCAKSDRELTADERREYAQRIRAQRRERDADKRRRRADAARRAAEIWNEATTGEHEYLTRKCVKAHGVRVYKGQLVIPMRDGNGDLASVQFIKPDGGKKFLTGGKVSGCYHAIGKPDRVLCIAEGYATAASIHEATGYAVACAFSAGNLKPVAVALREKFPKIKLFVCADNDADTDGNPGVTKATTAAESVRACLAVPADSGDFNDLQSAQGVDAVRAAIDGAAATEKPAELDRVSSSEADDDAAMVAELAGLGPIQYGQRRKEVAKQLGVSVGTVDEAVRLARRESAASESKLNLLFPTIEPCRDTVDGAELLTEIAAEIRRYVVLSGHADTAAALWVLHTYAIEAAYIAPILCVQSPQKRCGKTQLLKLLAALVRNGLLTENFSLAALYRVMDEYRPTLFIDEADAFLDQQEEIRGIINSGHSRGGKTLRVGGENRDQVEVFDSFGPKAIAGIGKRKDTIADRSIVVELARRRKDEPVESLRLDRLDYRHIQARCAGWAEQNMDALKAADPAVPAILHDRAADNWRPLLAIAELCGWRAKAVKAATALTETDDSETVGIMVLEDIRRLFTDKAAERMASADIVAALADMEDRPWPEWGRTQKPITQRQLARLLEPFKIIPKSVRIGDKTPKGYDLGQFSDSFTRYLSGNSSATPQQTSNGGACDPFSSATQQNHVADRSATETHPVADKNGLKANGDKGCGGVADRSAENEGGEKTEGQSEPPEYRI